jgi:hypothetical protein
MTEQCDSTFSARTVCSLDAGHESAHFSQLEDGAAVRWRNQEIADERQWLLTGMTAED